MTRKDLLKVHEEVTTKARKLLEKRNKEYASDEDPFWNFEEQARFAEIPVEKVFLMYLQENTGRLKTIMKQGNTERGQIEDKAVDLVNFAVLYLAWLQEHQK